MNGNDAVKPALTEISIADLGVVLGACVGVADRYNQFCHGIANIVTFIGRELNSGAERGFSAIAGPHRLGEIAEEARQQRAAEQRATPTEDIKTTVPRARPTSVVTATVACSQFSVTKRTLQRAVHDGRLKDFRESARASNTPLLVDLHEVAAIWPKRGATK